MPWKCFPEIGKPFPGNWQCSATKRMYISSLSQNRFWSDSKLIQIRFKTGSDLTQDWIWLPSHPSCQVWREEEALTFPDWFNTEFGCHLTLPVMCAERRRPWHFQTDSTLNFVALSCRVQRWGGSDISRLIQVWILYQVWNFLWLTTVQYKVKFNFHEIC